MKEAEGNFQSTEAVPSPWRRLPCEIKRKILIYCLNPHPEIYMQKRSTLPSRRRFPKNVNVIIEIRRMLFPETTSLLEVSQESRTIILDIIFENLVFPCHSIEQFSRSINRLSHYYQLSKDGAIPSTESDIVLAQIYRRFPRYFPELDRFAMMSHGIQNVYIKFDWLDSLHFFKVPVGTLPLYRGRDLTTVDYFERLPNLRRVAVVLPSGFKFWRDKSPITQPGPRLFHETDPCPRMIHRWIYESIAEELAIVPEIRVTGFVDQVEEETFWNLRYAAKNKLPIKPSEAKELYADLEGGVPIDTHIEIISKGLRERPQRTPRRRRQYYKCAGVMDEIFPPVCQCEVPCKDAFRNM